jgi:chitinase
VTPEEQAHAAAVESFGLSTPARRRLSWLRIGGVAAVVGAVTAGLVGFTTHDTAKPAAAQELHSSFAPYVDVTATPQYAFEDPTVSAAKNLVLGFVVSDPSTACQPSWGGYYSLASAASGMDLDRRIARVRQRGGQVAASFGGAANSELAIGCTNPNDLVAAYQAVVERYSLTSVDVDVEGETASATDVDVRRAEAVHTVQAAQQAAGKQLDVWLTLPVDPNGLTSSGQAVLDAMLAAHVDVAGVNAMTMDYGLSRVAGQSMLAASESALTSLHAQLVAAYGKYGTTLSADAAWQRIGATPMVGQNDTADERFELSDATTLVAFAKTHHLRRLSMWSANRDQPCGPNYANVEVVSDNCSGVSQTAQAFSKTFAAFGNGVLAAASPTPSTSPTTMPTPSASTSTTDDAATSPYAIWNPAATYPKNTKIVWHHNVYEAKYSTSGDTPDAPVASVSDTPWTLIGPVLPGEHPASLPTVAAGTYPDWDSSGIYVAGDKVIYDGTGYQAKWWSQGDTPGQDVLNPSDTPWQVISGS